VSNALSLEQQGQVKRLLRHWRKYEAKQTFPLTLLALVVCVISVIDFFLWKKILWTVTSISFAAVGYGLMYVRWRTKRKFVQQLTDDELHLLAQANGTFLNDTEKQSFREIRKVVQKAVPKDEFLRASQQPENDDTLLRAATHGSEVPREELLRASNTSAQEQRHEENISLVAR
jgi:hypothetical protein